MTLGRKTGGRTKEFDQQLRLSISSKMLAELDAVTGENENRLAVIREAIAREIKRRSRIR